MIMSKAKKMVFKLNPEWMLKEPVDFEYNKYTLLDYLQKCEKRFDNLELYPDFIELSLHLANLQSLAKENMLLLTKKKFESCDDEILLKELYPKTPRELTKDEEDELDKTMRFSGGKLFDVFNIGKSIWNVAFDNVIISIKKNKKNFAFDKGYVFYYCKHIDTLYVWEYENKKRRGDNVSSKTILNLIYKESSEDLSLNTIIETNSTWNTTDDYQHLPIFEMKCSQNFPMEQTMIPIMKRKIMSFIFQHSKLQNFDL
jgi:hypothetical protein